MIVANDISHDTRVLKSALALADGGAAVTILGVSSRGALEESRLGPVDIVRVPVTFDQRDAARASADPRPVRLAPTPQARRAALERARTAAREASDSGLVRDRARAARARSGVAAMRAGLAAEQRAQSVLARARRLRARVRGVEPVVVSWRSVLPAILDYESALGPVVDGLDWEVIHAHDVHLVGVAARAVERRRASGGTGAWVYDAHEYVAGLSEYASRPRRVIAAYAALEKEFVRRARGVITVSEPLADVLQARYRLPATPTVVMNSPVLDAAASPVEQDVRAVCGLDQDTPLLVYSGGVNPARGIATAVAALALLPGVHLAVVCVPGTHASPVARLRTQARSLGVEDRVYFLEPVRPEEVSAFLRGADVGLLPFLHYGSHEVALANKLFEYLFAGVPVLASDCRAQSAFVRAHGVGEVFTAGSAAELAAQATALLERSAHYRAVIADQPDLLSPFAWEVQERSLRSAYRGWFGAESLVEPTSSTAVEGLTETTVVRAEVTTPHVAFGSAQVDGVLGRWAEALAAAAPGVRTEVICLDRDHSPYPADVAVSRERAAQASWSEPFARAALQRWTHALLEHDRTAFGDAPGRTPEGDVAALVARGIRVARVVHALEGGATPPGDGLLLVPAPELAHRLPGAQWVPDVVDPDPWSAAADLLAPSRPPVVLSLTRAAELAPLVNEGLIEVRVRGEAGGDLAPADLTGVDVVVDDLVADGYSRAAVQAMMAGRVVVGRVSDSVRDLCPLPLPVLDADPSTVAEVLRGVLADRDAARNQAAEGRTYAVAVHGGERSGSLLASLLDLSLP